MDVRLRFSIALSGSMPSFNAKHKLHIYFSVQLVQIHVGDLELVDDKIQFFANESANVPANDRSEHDDVMRRSTPERRR